MQTVTYFHALAPPRRLAVHGIVLAQQGPVHCGRWNRWHHTFRRWRRFEEAEKLLEAALPAAEGISGDDHPRVALVLQALAGVFARTRRISFAEGLYKCAPAVPTSFAFSTSNPG